MNSKPILSLILILFLCFTSLGSLTAQPAAAQTPTENWVALGDTPAQAAIQPASPASESKTPPASDLVDFTTLEEITTFDPSEFLARGVIITPTAMTGEGAPGEDIVYVMAVGNRGSEPDTFDIDMTSGWDATISADEIGPLDPGENATLVLTVTIPIFGDPGEFDTAQVTATSQADPTKNAIATRITFVEFPVIEVAPLDATTTGYPGETITYTFTVTNIGEITNTFTVTIVSEWATTGAPIIGPMIPGETLSYPVQVIVPNDATSLDSDTALITFSSALPGAMDVTASLTTVARTDYGLAVTAEQDTLIADKPSVIVGFTLHVTNTGDLTDSYDLSVDSTWEVSYPALIGPLAPGESQVVVIMVTVPADVDTGDVNVSLARFTSQGDPAVYREIELTTLIIWHYLYLPMTVKN